MSAAARLPDARCSRATTFDFIPKLPQAGEEGTLNVFSQKHNKWHNFRFDRVFGEGSTQDDVYAETQPLIRSVLDGKARARWRDMWLGWLWPVVGWLHDSCDSCMASRCGG